MGFLTKAAREEDVDDEGTELEQHYLRVFPKIGRDFVHKEDLLAILQQIMDLVDPEGFNPINLEDDSEARQRAKEYKAFAAQSRSGAEVYRDLIRLDEDGDDA